MRLDYEYSISTGIVKVGRMYPFSLKSQMEQPIEQEGEQSLTHVETRVALEMTKPSRLNTLHWTRVANADHGEALRPDEVEVKIFAAGLNFKDVLGALRVIPFPEKGLGLEGSGIVSRVSADVKDLQSEDRVMFLADGSFASHVTRRSSAKRLQRACHMKTQRPCQLSSQSSLPDCSALVS